MKNKWICLLLAAILFLSSFLFLSACGNSEEPSGEHECIDADKDGKCDVCGKAMENGKKHKHVDKNDDGKCDECGADMEKAEIESPYDWDKTRLICQMTKHSNNQQLPSGCERYMAGEDESATEQVDDMIRERNADCYEYTNLDLVYLYYPDATGYGWGHGIDATYDTVMSKDPDTPDIYINFFFDVVCTSLKGSFANLCSTSRGVGELRGENYFQFLDKNYDEETNSLGYMYEFMRYCTLSKFKMYVVASDYFIDMVRGFLVTPVNVKLMNSVVEEVIGDVDEDGTCDINDFYAMVKKGDWNYEMMIDFCEVSYQAGANSTGAIDIHDDVVGFAVGDGGLISVGLLYTSPIVIIHRDWSEEREDYDYYYSETNPELETFCTNLKTLFESTGVCMTHTNVDLGATPELGVRTRFTQNHVLFGGVITIGSLEYGVYQDMKNGVGVSEDDVSSQNYGFGLAPIPLYRAGEKYMTIADSGCGKLGGISAATTKFAQCTAFLDYMSTHSTDILNEYYDYKLQYDVAGGTPGNVYILQYIRKNVRSAFDYIYEEAIRQFFLASDPTANDYLWRNVIRYASYKVTNFAEKYAEIYPTKAVYLETLINEYDKLPD